MPDDPLADYLANQAFGEAVDALQPQDLTVFSRQQGFLTTRILLLAGLDAGASANWGPDSPPTPEDWSRVQGALYFARHDRLLRPRRRALEEHPDLARDLRWLVELAVQHGDLSERAAATMLGLDFEAWNALPPQNGRQGDT